MKVLFWVDKFPTFSETFIRDQIVHLLDQDVEVLIYANGKINTEERTALSNFESYQLLDKMVDIDFYFNENKLKRIFKALLILVHSIFNKNYNHYKKTLSFNKYGAVSKSLRLFFRVHFLLKNNISIVHAHFGPNGNNAVVFKKLNLPIKLFTTFHGYDIRLGLKKGPELYCDLFKYSEGVFSISEFNLKSLLKLGAPRNKILPLLNGINVDFYKRVKAAAKPEVLKMITVARLVEEKSLDIAIQAIYELKKRDPRLVFEYIIVGEGDLRFELQELINTLGLSEKIKLVGAKNSTQVRDLLVNSDLFLLPSKAEASPTVLLEAQASGLVVLATNVGAVTNIVKGGFTVAPLDIDQFTKGLTQLINTKQNWNELTKEGRASVCNHHDIKKQTKKLIAFYNLQA